MVLIKIVPVSIELLSEMNEIMHVETLRIVSGT